MLQDISKYLNLRTLQQQHYHKLQQQNVLLSLLTKLLIHPFIVLYKIIDIKNMDQYSVKNTRLLHVNYEMMMIVYGLLKYKRRTNG